MLASSNFQTSSLYHLKAHYTDGAAATRVVPHIYTASLLGKRKKAKTELQ